MQWGQRQWGPSSQTLHLAGQRGAAGEGGEEEEGEGGEDREGEEEEEGKGEEEEMEHRAVMYFITLQVVHRHSLQPGSAELQFGAVL